VWEAANFIDDIRDGSEPINLSKKILNGTEFTSKRTSPCDLDDIHGKISLPGEDVSPGHRDFCQICVTFLPVKGLEIFRSRIFDETRPDFFSLSDDNRIGMFFGLIRNGCRMDPTENNGYSFFPVSISDVISP
jgi:hypothetical protein